MVARPRRGQASSAAQRLPTARRPAAPARAVTRDGVGCNATPTVKRRQPRRRTGRQTVCGIAAQSISIIVVKPAPRRQQQAGANRRGKDMRDVNPDVRTRQAKGLQALQTARKTAGSRNNLNFVNICGSHGV